MIAYLRLIVMELEGVKSLKDEIRPVEVWTGFELVFFDCDFVFCKGVRD